VTSAQTRAHSRHARAGSNIVELALWRLVPGLRVREFFRGSMAGLCAPLQTLRPLADNDARLGAMGRYSFIGVDLHHMLLAGLPVHSL